MTIAAALIYTAGFARFISRHTSLPFWDGYVYVVKTAALAEKIHDASLLQRLNPGLYLNGPQPERPPLLIALAAMVLGPNPGNAAIAYVWLTVRVAVILLSLYLLSRAFGTSRFVPAAALVIFASPLMCNFNRLHFMDEPFAAFGLLAFTLLLIDDRRQSVGSALAASASILALFLIKPVAPAFVLPLCAIRGVRALLALRSAWPNRPQARRLMMWGLPYVLLLGLMLALLYASPYGPAVREQFKTGSAGYWRQELGAWGAIELVSLVLPPWLLLILMVLLPFSRGSQHRAVLVYALGGLLWWLLFSFFVAYTVEDRLVGQAMPYVVAGVLLWVCQRPRVALGVTVAAGCFFTHNTLVANGRVPLRSDANLVRFLSPVPLYQQPVPEVGLLPFARELNAATKAEGLAAAYAVFDDIYVAPSSLKMALGMSAQPQRVSVRGLPKSPRDFDIVQFCQTRWFITKSHRRHTGYANTGMWTTLNCVHALITDPESPLHPYFRKVLEAPIEQPDLKDTLVLWHLPSPPPNAAIVASLRWLQPRLVNDPRGAVIDAQLKALSASASREGVSP